jgi:RNA polymerase sigma-70 factor (ECF subfamily)
MEKFLRRSAGGLACLAVEKDDQQYEVELIQRIANGDQAAFAALYDRLSPILYSMALRMMNDAVEAEDVLQDGFVYIWQRANTFDASRGSPISWTITIVRHKAIDRLRVRLRGERLRERASASPELASDKDDQSAVEPFLREQRAQVKSALAKLPGEQREALQLAFFSGLTHQQIAAKIATPLGTVKARIRRGLLQLRQLLQSGR